MAAVENLTHPGDARESIQNGIIQSVRQDGPVRFKVFNPPPPGSSALMAHLTIKHYDKGSRFARAMPAGLGILVRRSKN